MFSFGTHGGETGVRGEAKINFPGRIVKDAGFFIASFPLKFSTEWENLATAMDTSTACVFFPDGSKLNGGHAKDSSAGDEPCHCTFLYGEVKPWGCAWYQCWKQRVHETIDQGQQVVVVYFEGQ